MATAEGLEPSCLRAGIKTLCVYHFTTPLYWYAQLESNRHCWFRRPVLYPLSYERRLVRPVGVEPTLLRLKVECFTTKLRAHLISYFLYLLYTKIKIFSNLFKIERSTNKNKSTINHSNNNN